MSLQYAIAVEPREQKGTAASRRFRREGKVPAVIYGAGGGNREFLIDHDELMHKLAVEGFHSAIIELQTADGTEKAILRDVQMHPYRPQVMHVDFQRISETEKLHIAIPLHFIGEDVAPGVKTQGGIMSHLMNEVDIECLPGQLPEYLEIDVSELHLHDSVKLSDIKVPEGVTITALAHGGEDQVVAAVSPPQTGAIEEEVAEEAAAAVAEAPEEETE